MNNAINWWYEFCEDQRIRFLIIGVINTGFGVVSTFMFLEFFFSNIFLALIAANVVNISQAFILHKVFVYGDFSVWTFGQYFKSYLTYGTSTVLSFGLIPFFLFLGWGSFLSVLVCTGCTTIVSYLGHKNITFRN